MAHQFVRLMSVVVSCVFLSSPSYAQMHCDKPKDSTIHVAGKASITLPHDTASLKGAAITYSTKAQDAVRENARIVQKIRDTIAKSGLKSKNVMTQNYQLVTNYDYNNGVQTFKNYSVIHEVKISTSNLDKIGQIADLFTQSGGNQINAIEFSSVKADNAYNLAIKNAVIDAKKKAEIVATNANMHLGRMIDVQVAPQSEAPQPVMMARAYADAEGKAAEPTHFQTDGQVITVTVQTSWHAVP